MKYTQQKLYPNDNYQGYEQQTVNLFQNMIQPDWTVFDCGAKTGYFTLLFSELCEEGKVHSFEPTSTFEMLCDNVNFYSLNNIILNNLALGETSGDIEDNIYRIWGQSPEKQIYKFTTIDEYCKKNKIKKLNLIKVDVDSYDFELLKGAVNTLEDLKPIITVELNHALNLRNSSPEEVIEWLKLHNYELNQVTDNENYTFSYTQPN
jgi:FkbM family methyltransferase